MFIELCVPMIHNAAIMLNKKEIIHTVQTVLQQYPYVLKTELFGSQQREEAGSDSDTDLIVMFDPITFREGMAESGFNTARQ
jgi:predicted nucleotidyltransferase